MYQCDNNHSILVKNDRNGVIHINGRKTENNSRILVLCLVWDQMRWWGELWGDRSQQVFYKDYEDYDDFGDFDQFGKCDDHGDFDVATKGSPMKFSRFPPKSNWAPPPRAPKRAHWGTFWGIILPLWGVLKSFSKKPSW